MILSQTYEGILPESMLVTVKDMSMGWPVELLMRLSVQSPVTGSISGGCTASARGGLPGPRRPVPPSLAGRAAAEPPALATGGTGRDPSTGEARTACWDERGALSSGSSLSSSSMTRRRTGHCDCLVAATASWLSTT